MHRRFIPPSSQFSDFQLLKSTKCQLAIVVIVKMVVHIPFFAFGHKRTEHTIIFMEDDLFHANFSVFYRKTHITCWHARRPYISGRIAKSWLSGKVHVQLFLDKKSLLVSRWFRGYLIKKYNTISPENRTIDTTDELIANYILLYLQGVHCSTYMSKKNIRIFFLLASAHVQRQRPNHKKKVT